MTASYGLTQFEWDDELDLKNFTCWVVDFVHGQPYTPLAAWEFCDAHMGMHYACELLSVPECKGWQWRLVDGWARLTLIEPRDEEVPERARVFRERMAPLIEDFDRLWGDAVADMLERYRPFKESDIENISNVELLRLFEDVFPVHRKQWEVHFYWMFFCYSVYLLFEEMCTELFGIRGEDPQFKKLLGGFDNELFRVNREMWQLGDRAKELGLADLVLTTEDDEQVMSKLEQSDAGRKWLDEYRGFLQRDGWRCERMLDIASPNWIEKPSLGISDIRRGIAKGGAFVLDQERERLAREREETEREILAKVSAEQREWFTKLMRIAQSAGVFSETHNYYLDMQSHAVVRKVVWEVGQRLARAGVIAEPFDVYFLMREEIIWALIPMERVSLRRHVERRKEEWKRNIANPPEMFHGNVEQLGAMLAKNAVLRVTVPNPIVKPELKADLYGTASSSGVVEGIARVVMSEAQLPEIQTGDILVAPGTSAPWTPIFGIISGVVTDGGGALSHAVIVGREYGIPAVAGTLEATSKIKTGQRIRVDGTSGVVYILD